MGEQLVAAGGHAEAGAPHGEGGGDGGGRVGARAVLGLKGGRSGGGGGRERGGQGSAAPVGRRPPAVGAFAPRDGYPVRGLALPGDELPSRLDAPGTGPDVVGKVTVHPMHRGGGHGVEMAAAARAPVELVLVVVVVAERGRSHDDTSSSCTSST